jgi:hypothetical protein
MTCDDPRVIILEYWRGICDCSLRLESFQSDGLDLQTSRLTAFHDLVLRISQCKEFGSEPLSRDAMLVIDISK